MSGLCIASTGTPRGWSCWCVHLEHFGRFSRCFGLTQIERSYVAVVEGIIEPERGTIDLPLCVDRGDGRRGTGAFNGDGVRAITHYERIEQFGGTAAQVDVPARNRSDASDSDPLGKYRPSGRWRACLSPADCAPFSRSVSAAGTSCKAWASCIR